MVLHLDRQIELTLEVLRRTAGPGNFGVAFTGAHGAAVVEASSIDGAVVVKAIDEIKKFILFIGPISSIFDYTTYFVMLYIFKCWDPSKASLFQTGWFVESLMTQTLIIHVIRTNKIPFLQSRSSLPLVVTSVIVLAFGIWLPFSPFASSLGFVELPPLYWPILFVTLLGYITLTQTIKMRLLRRGWI